MKPDITEGDNPSRPLWRRLAWFVGIWTTSVLALTLVAGLIRLALPAA